MALEVSRVFVFHSVQFPFAEKRPRRAGHPAPALLHTKKRLLKHHEFKPYKDAIDVDGEPF